MVDEYTIEGTWEEIAARADEFAGRRVRLVVVPAPNETDPSENGDRNNADGQKTIEEIAEELFADIPPEEWAKLPPDLTDHLDHYIYGTPKR